MGKLNFDKILLACNSNLEASCLPALVYKSSLVDGHHAVRPRGCLVGWSLLLGEMVASHTDIHIRLG